MSSKKIMIDENGFVDVKNMTWSFSRLNSFYTCPYCWAMNYIFRREDSMQNAFAQYGTLCHEILEKFAKNQLMIWDLVDEFKKSFEFMITNDFPPNKYVDLRNSYYKQGIDYFINFNGFSNYEIISVEEEVKLKIEDYEFTGFIDLVVRDKTDNKIIVIDHKSKSSFKNKEEQKEYTRQLYLYSSFIKQKYKEYPKQLKFNMFRKKKWVIIPFKLKDLEEAKEWMLKTIDKISKTKEFPVIEDDFFGQYLCNFRHDENHKKGYVLRI